CGREAGARVGAEAHGAAAGACAACGWRRCAVQAGRGPVTVAVADRRVGSAGCARVRRAAVRTGGGIVSAVVGIDSSLTISGCALVEWHPGTDFPGPAWSTWRGRAAKPEAESVESTRRRIRVMLREILAFVPARVDLAVVEGPSMGQRHAALADERA